MGYYGISNKGEFDERSAGEALADFVQRWEKAAAEAKTTTTVVRTGVVLEKGGGALGKILPIFQLYTGGPLGSGKQWVSWIHRDDLVALIVAAQKTQEVRRGDQRCGARTHHDEWTVR